MKLKQKTPTTKSFSLCNTLESSPLNLILSGTGTFSAAQTNLSPAQPSQAQKLTNNTLTWLRISPSLSPKLWTAVPESTSKGFQTLPLQTSWTSSASALIGSKATPAMTCLGGIFQLLNKLWQKATLNAQITCGIDLL